jgi:Nucleotidyl transferase of unknown function (DUF2204)
MEDKLIKQILEICGILNKYDVDYLIVGGTALAFHGHYRATRAPDNTISEKHDFDFWYNPSYENYFNLLKALEELGVDITKYKNEKSPNPKKSYFKHEFEDFKVDFLPEIKGLSKFNNSFSNAEVSSINNISIYILSKDDLIKSKEATARDKDRDDLNELRALFPEE